MKLTKVAGAENPSDLVTKHLSAAVAKGHLERLCMRACGGRATTAPTMASVNPCMPVRPLRVDSSLARTAASTQQFACADPSHAGEPENDQWLEAPTHCVRVHKNSRNCFFTPPRVAGIPPSKALAAVRITEGCYVDNGEKYRRVDNWTGRTAHQILHRRWTGKTTFMRVSFE